MADADDHLVDEEDKLPATEPKSSRLWLARIEQAQKAFEEYQEKADRIDRLYADLTRLATDARDREFQMFWANVEVLKPSVYSRPPVPVVTPRFKDRKRVPRTASEVLERCLVVSFDQNDIDGTMRLIRDDLVIPARGVAWVRYETKAQSKGQTEKACVEHTDRKDFLHQPARKWQEVGWVAKRSWLSKKEMKKRFKKTSGNAYLEAEYIVRKDDKENGAAGQEIKAGVWEVWSKDDDKVVWVTPGVKVLLDSDDPHLKLEKFFPCPQPAYGTTQRRSLIPVPDMLFYKDQLEEINELTGRISALTGAVRVRGFYPAGAGEIGDAIEAAIKSLDDRQVMIGVSNWAAFGGAGAKDTIVWLPIDMIVTTIAALIEQRRQIIDDVYQITGLSDIMRGATDPSETLGAQQLKSQYGSIRIRDRQSELVRVARDVTRIVAEIMAEHFSKDTLLEMSQLELPAEADIKKQLKALEKQADDLGKQVEAQIKQLQASGQPEEAVQQAGQQVQQQYEEQIRLIQQQAEKLNEETTIDEVMDLLREQKTRPFILDIETDSTIQPDEDAEKQRRAEFMTALAGALQQLFPMVQAQPETATFAGEMLKFAMSPYRAGRALEGSIDEFVDQMKARAGQPQPNPEAEAAAAEAKAREMEAQSNAQATAADAQAKTAEAHARLIKANSDAADAELSRRIKEQQEVDAFEARRAEMADKRAMTQQQMEQSAREHEQRMEIGRLSITEQQLKIGSIGMKAEIEAASAEQRAEHNEQAFEQKSALTAQQAAGRAP